MTAGGAAFAVGPANFVTGPTGSISGVSVPARSCILPSGVGSAAIPVGLVVPVVLNAPQLPPGLYFPITGTTLEGAVRWARITVCNETDVPLATGTVTYTSRIIPIS